jgi:hypothetical protein
MSKPRTQRTTTWSLEDLGLRMHNWHASQGDPVYAVGSYFAGGRDYPDLNVVMEAHDILERLSRPPHSDSFKKRDIKELKQIVAHLSRYIKERDLAYAMNAKSRHLSHSFYRVTDREAGKIARDSGSRPPKPGYEQSVEVDASMLGLPSGQRGYKTRCWLTRTPYSRSAGHKDAPARGWVWALSCAPCRSCGEPVWIDGRGHCMAHAGRS